MSDINPIEYGKLVNAVENLEGKVNSMDADIKRLVAMAERSKGSLWALMGVASVAGAFISYVSEMMLSGLYSGLLTTLPLLRTLPHGGMTRVKMLKLELS